MGRPILFDVWAFFAMCEKGRVGRLLATTRSSGERSTGPFSDPTHPPVKVGHCQALK
jgi:hypothetical protein